MTITNETLINMIRLYGEDRITTLLEQKLQNDAYRKQYNKNRNAVLSMARKDPRFAELMKQYR